MTLSRLDKALKESSIIQNSYLCVTADKAEIKDKLKEACRQEEKVQIARKVSFYFLHSLKFGLGICN